MVERREALTMTDFPATMIFIINEFPEQPPPT
jgi:hypothetical protein